MTRSSGVLTAWMSSQAIFRARDMLAAFLNLDADRIKVHNAEVGGAFGAKNALLGEEIIAATLAIKYGRPVKWIESRSENLQAQTQGRGWVNYYRGSHQERWAIARSKGTVDCRHGSVQLRSIGNDSSTYAVFSKWRLPGSGSG